MHNQFIFGNNIANVNIYQKSLRHLFHISPSPWVGPQKLTLCKITQSLTLAKLFSGEGLPFPRFFSGFALNSRALCAFDSGLALDSRALRSLDPGFALNFGLENLVCPPPINSWIRQCLSVTIDDEFKMHVGCMVRVFTSCTRYELYASLSVTMLHEHSSIHSLSLGWTTATPYYLVSHA